MTTKSRLKCCIEAASGQPEIKRRIHKVAHIAGAIDFARYRHRAFARDKGLRRVKAIRIMPR
jgi:hypothetical protein